MNKRTTPGRTVPHRLGAFAILILICAMPPLFVGDPGQGTSDSQDQPHVTLKNMPLAFVENEGQIQPGFQFEARSPGGTLGFASDHVLMTLPREDDKPSGLAGWAPSEAAVVRLAFLGAKSCDIEPLQSAPGVVNYLLGNDPNQWLTRVPTWASIVYRSLYDGVDLVYDGTDGRLKGTYHLSPGVDADQIRWRYDGVSSVELGDEGEVRMTVALDGRTVVEEAPIAWQVIGGRRTPVDIGYVLNQEGELGFKVGRHVVDEPLVIDPTVVYSTMLGGNGTDHGLAVAMDDQGNVYVTGRTHSNPSIVYGAGFPTANPLFGYGGEIADAYVTKLDPTGSVMEYSTFLGGGNPFDLSASGGADWGIDIAVGDDGAVCVVGMTESLNFPVTLSAAQSTKVGGFTDAFLTRIGPGGDTLEYSTYFGGTGDDFAFSVHVDDQERIYIGGFTGSTDFPTTPGCLQPYHSGGTEGFLVRVDLVNWQFYSTFLGFSGDDLVFSIDVDDAGIIHATGRTTSNLDISPLLPPGVVPFQATNAGASDAFLAKVAPFSTGANDLLYFTYLGGSFAEEAWGVACGSDNNVYLTGVTLSPDFPTEHTSLYYGGSGDAFVTRLIANGNGVLDMKYSIYIGASAYDHGFDVAESNGMVYVCGMFGNWGSSDGFLIRISPYGDVLAADVFGGDAFDMAIGVAVGPNDAVTVVGYSMCPEPTGPGSCSALSFPILNALQPTYGGGSGDAFIRTYSDF